MYKWSSNGKLGLIVDITTYCNAKCPQCSRTSLDNKLARNEFFPLIHWTLPEVQMAYPAEQLDGVNRISFSPTWGDAMMNPDVFDIIEHFLNSVPDKSEIRINTNGSMRDEDFWWKFGYLALKYNKKIFTVVFDVDGINQEMHSKYRRNTNLQKVLNNMKAFSDNGQSNVRSQTIVFKHNQDYLEEIGQLTKDYGSVGHTFIKSDRFKPDENGEYQPFVFQNEKGEDDILEWADKEFEDPFMAHFYRYDHELNNNIACKWAMDNILNINFDGQVWPCCYFGNGDYSPYQEEFRKHSLIHHYNLMRLESNVKFTPLKEIIRNEWFDGELQENIKGNNPTFQCQKHCSTRIRDFNKQQVRMLYK